MEKKLYQNYSNILEKLEAYKNGSPIETTEIKEDIKRFQKSAFLFEIKAILVYLGGLGTFSAFLSHEIENMIILLEKGNLLFQLEVMDMMDLKGLMYLCLSALLMAKSLQNRDELDELQWNIKKIKRTLE